MNIWKNLNLRRARFKRPMNSHQRRILNRKAIQFSKDPKWVERWYVVKLFRPLFPQGRILILGKRFIVGRDIKGNFGCSCMHWHNTHEACNHIQEVRKGNGISEAEYVYLKLQGKIED